MPSSVVAPIVGALASNLVGGLMGKKDKAPAVAAPTVTPVTAMPDPMAQKAQERRKAAVSLSRQLNAADTVLTGGDTKLGA